MMLDMAIPAKALAVLRGVGVAAIAQRFLVVNLKASGFLASLAAPPSGVKEAAAKAYPFLSIEACMKSAHISCREGESPFS